MVIRRKMQVNNKYPILFFCFFYKNDHQSSLQASKHHSSQKWKHMKQEVGHRKYDSVCVRRYYTFGQKQLGRNNWRKQRIVEKTQNKWTHYRVISLRSWDTGQGGKKSTISAITGDKVWCCVQKSKRGLNLICLTHLSFSSYTASVSDFSTLLVTVTL